LKSFLSSALFILVAAGALAQDSDATKYFAKTRKVQATPGRVNYILLDAPVFQGSQSGLNDLRLYATGSEIPFALRSAAAKVRRDFSSVRLLNKGRTTDGVRFLLDIPELEYDRIRLEIGAHDFIARARVKGGDSNSSPWTDLGEFTLFDFTREQLGENQTIQLKTPVRFRFLEVTIAPPITPDDVDSASVADWQQEDARYMEAFAPVSPHPGTKQSIFEFAGDRRVPVDKLHFDVDPAEVNFNRQVSVICDNYNAWSGSLSRVRLERKGRRIESEELDLYPSAQCDRYKVIVANGDDPPLRGLKLHSFMVERRIYFDPRGNSDIAFYYGDKKVGSPVYDFDKFFTEPDPGKAVQADMGPEALNPNYAQRPDERPWTEQHPWVMWTALIAAVLALGGWALKGFKG
jgi:hypothetical protein